MWERIFGNLQIYFPPHATIICKNSVKLTIPLKSYTVYHFEEIFLQWGKISEITTLCAISTLLSRFSSFVKRNFSFMSSIIVNWIHEIFFQVRIISVFSRQLFYQYFFFVESNFLIKFHRKLISRYLFIARLNIQQIFFTLPCGRFQNSECIYMKIVNFTIL